MDAITAGTTRLRRQWLLVALIVLAIGLGYLGLRERRHGPGPAVTVTVPVLSEQARAGRALFDRWCAACHGTHASGGATGPPLVHQIYNPRHHADVAFTLAVQRGVRAHHWRFGDMPPLPSVRADELEPIVRYVRELQRANGIE